MTDILERMGRDLMEISYDDIEAMVREAAAEIERLRTEHESYVEWTQANLEPKAEIERLRAEIEWLREVVAAAAPAPALEPKP